MAVTVLPGITLKSPDQLFLVLDKKGIIIVEEKVVVWMDNSELERVGPTPLAPQERWEHIVEFMPKRDGTDQKVKFLLYKMEGDDPRFMEVNQILIDVGQVEPL